MVSLFIYTPQTIYYKHRIRKSKKSISKLISKLFYHKKQAQTTLKVENIRLDLKLYLLKSRFNTYIKLTKQKDKRLYVRTLY